MYRTVDDFLTDWKRESEGTHTILASLTDNSLARKVDPEGRSLGFIAWHMVITIGWMAVNTGLAFDSPTEDSPAPECAEMIAATYRSCADKLAEAVKREWNDRALLDELDMYGEKWMKGFLLASIIRHEAHHRGQMTVLMRQAGLPVPGIYGPSREEWEKLGMERRK